MSTADNASNPFKPVKSSSVKGYSYDANRHELRITFVSGAEYVYRDINPAAMSEVFDSPGSIGQKVSKLAKRHKGLKEA